VHTHFQNRQLPSIFLLSVAVAAVEQMQEVELAAVALCINARFRFLQDKLSSFQMALAEG
jgi:hypothetical protein